MTNTDALARRIRELQGEYEDAKRNKKTKLFCMRLPAHIFERINATKLPGTSAADFVRLAINDKLNGGH